MIAWLVAPLLTGCASTPKPAPASADPAPAAPEVAPVASAWEFYMTTVDEAPASVRVDLAFRDSVPGQWTHHYRVALPMTDPGPHGMGTQAAADAFHPVEAALLSTLVGSPLQLVARRRSAGHWTMMWYGPHDQKPTLEAAAASVGARKATITVRDDPGFTVYDRELAPSAERWQWILDRRVVDGLWAEGDRLTEPRPIDHHVVLPDQAAADAFMGWATVQGLDPTATPGDDGVAVSMQVVAVPELERVHATVMEIKAQAESQGGRYQGWGCYAVTTPAGP